MASLAATDAVCFWFMHIHDGEFARLPQAALPARASRPGRASPSAGAWISSILEHEMAADYGALRELTARLGERLDGLSARARHDAGRHRLHVRRDRARVEARRRRARSARRVRQPAGRRGVRGAARHRRRRRLRDRPLDRPRRRGAGRRADPADVRARAASSSIEGGRSADATRAAIAEAGAGADVVAELGIGTNERRAHHGQRDHRREGARHRARRVRRQRERELRRRQPRRRSTSTA